jgi:hypothetical protein
MSGDKENKGPVRWRPLYCDRYKSDTSDRITPDDVDEMQREMAMVNKQIAEQAADK